MTQTLATGAASRYTRPNHEQRALKPPTLIGVAVFANLAFCSLTLSSTLCTRMCMYFYIYICFCCARALTLSLSLTAFTECAGTINTLKSRHAERSAMFFHNVPQTQRIPFHFVPLWLCHSNLSQPPPYCGIGERAPNKHTLSHTQTLTHTGARVHSLTLSPHTLI